MMADAPANEAFQRYQQSAAAAAADQGTAEPAVSQATPPDVRSKVYCSAAGFLVFFQLLLSQMKKCCLHQHCNKFCMQALQPIGNVSAQGLHVEGQLLTQRS